MSYLQPDQNEHFKPLAGLKMAWESLLKSIWDYAGFLSVYLSNFLLYKVHEYLLFLARNKLLPKLASVRGVDSSV